MPSVLAWLDHDEREQDRVNQVLALFQESGTLDELGIGAIRDGLADLLFPGTSTIQTRLRYFLVVPWVYRTLERERVPASQVRRRAAALERDLIAPLLASGDRSGVFGRIAGRAVKLLPSSVYWSGLSRLGILRYDLSKAQYHRAFEQFWWTRADRSSAWHHVPPPPPGFPDELDLRLTCDEAHYLRERILTAAPESVLARLASLADQGSPADAEYIWQHPDFAQFTPEQQHLIDHAARFAGTIHGAHLLYNLMLAELRQHEEWIERYRGALVDWGEAVGALQLQSWDLEELWQLLEPTGYSVYVPTRRFVESWVDRARTGPRDIASDELARQLVRTREQAKKGSRSKFRNRAALDAWSGASGTSLLDYRWRRTVRGMLDDLHHGLQDSLNRGDDDART